MKIAIDIDGVLADAMPALNNYYNRIFGTNFEVSDYKFHDLEKTWQCPKEVVVRTVKEFYKTPDFWKIEPMPNSREGVLAISENHELFSVTSRPESTSAATGSFLKRNFGTLIKKVIYTGQYRDSASQISKGSVCITEGAHVLIEDCLETALSATQDGLDVFLFDNPGNQLNGNGIFVPARLLRITGGWREIVERLK